jgi:glycosyltransferase involved in cell wall biosynthesis
MISVSIIAILYNNADRFTVRLERDLIPTIHAHPDWKFQFVIVDNSDLDNKSTCQVLCDNDIEYVYLYPGNNIMYGPAMNLALESCKYPYVIYVCSNHGRMYDVTWIDDLLYPMIEDEKVAMTGSFYPSCSPVDMGFPPELPPIHIQGGLFGAKTAILQAFPYSLDQRWVHWGSDLYQSFQLLNTGFLLKDVPSIKSVWRQNLSSPERWKFVHDSSEE